MPNVLSKRSKQNNKTKLKLNKKMKKLREHKLNVIDPQKRLISKMFLYPEKTKA